MFSQGDGQMYKLTLGLSHSLLSGLPVWSHDFHTAKGSVKEYSLPLSEFVAGKRGQAVVGATLDIAEVQYLGVALSLVDQNGQPNPHFGDGPFRLVLHEISFE